MNHSTRPALLRNASLIKQYRLTTSGNQLVKPKDLVVENQVLSQSEHPAFEIVTLPISKMLRLSSQSAEKALIIRRGQRVSCGQLVAERKSWFTRHRVISPVDAVAYRYDRGTLYLRKNTPPLHVVSTMPGRIISISEDGIATVRTQGTVIAGAWRRGSASGKLVAAKSLSFDDLQPDDIGLEQTRRIVVGGHLANPAILKRAHLFGVSGIIASSMHHRIAEQAATSEIPIMLVVGIGKHSMSPQIIETIRELEGMMAFIDSGQPYCTDALVIPSQQESTVSLEPRFELCTGALVRVVGGPNHGQTATVITLKRQRLSKERNTVVSGAEVRLATGHVVFVAEANLQPLFGRSNTG